jgi:hypothetical protein
MRVVVRERANPEARRAANGRDEGDRGAIGRHGGAADVHPNAKVCAVRRDDRQIERWRWSDRAIACARPDECAGKRCGDDACQRRERPRETRRSPSARCDRVGRARRRLVRCLEHDRRIADVAQPLPAVALEAALQQTPDTCRRARGQQRPVDLLPQHRGERVAHRLASEQLSSRQHLEQHDAERPDVRAFVDRPAARLFRRHVRRRPENHPQFRRVYRHRRRVGDVDARLADGRERFGETEVEHLDRAILADLYIRRFEIAMDDAVFVGRVERGRDLARDREGGGDRQRALRDLLR